MATISSILQLMRPAFRAAEFAALLGKGNGYAYVVLHRLKKAGKIASVRRGWWAKADSMPEQAACAISSPCYVSFHSALYLHHLTTQIPLTVQLAVARKAVRYGLVGARAQEYRIPTGMFNGFAAIDGLALAGAEKAFADCLKVPHACPEMILIAAFPSLDESKILIRCTPAMRRRLAKVKKLCSQEKTWP